MSTAVADYVARTVAEAPQLTAEQRARLTGLLRPRAAVSSHTRKARRP
jgi:hypothetical protein